MDCPAGTVMSRLYRGRKICRDCSTTTPSSRGSFTPAASAARSQRRRVTPPRPLDLRCHRCKRCRRGRPRMNCAKATTTSQAYVDGELDGVGSRIGGTTSGLRVPTCAGRVRLHPWFHAAVRAHLHRPEVPFDVCVGGWTRCWRPQPIASRRWPVWLSYCPRVVPGAAALSPYRCYNRDRSVVVLDGAPAVGTLPSSTPGCRYWTSRGPTAVRLHRGLRGRLEFPRARARAGRRRHLPGGPAANVG